MPNTMFWYSDIDPKQHFKKHLFSWNIKRGRLKYFKTFVKSFTQNNFHSLVYKNSHPLKYLQQFTSSEWDT